MSVLIAVGMMLASLHLLGSRTSRFEGQGECEKGRHVFHTYRNRRYARAPLPNEVCRCGAQTYRQYCIQLHQSTLNAVRGASTKANHD